jgi:hypothetical protein
MADVGWTWASLRAAEGTGSLAALRFRNADAARATSAQRHAELTFLGALAEPATAGKAGAPLWPRSYARSQPHARAASRQRRQTDPRLVAGRARGDGDDAELKREVELGSRGPVNGARRVTASA